MTKNKKLTVFIIAGLIAIIALALVACKMAGNTEVVQEEQPIVNQWSTIDDADCYLDSDGNLSIGWVQIAPEEGAPNVEEWCYFDENGKFVEDYDKSFEGETTIFVDISKQKLTYFDNGIVKLHCPIISGTKGENDTPQGEYEILSMNPDNRIVGPTWDYDHVIWMAFIGQLYGLHSAWWQDDALFEDPHTYETEGSHGCVNMREKDAKALYDMIEIGTKVIIQE